MAIHWPLGFYLLYPGAFFYVQILDRNFSEIFSDFLKKLKL